MMDKLTIYKDSIDEINQLHKEIQQGFFDALARGKRIGKLLIQEKRKLKHGDWISWINKELDFGREQATKYIKVYVKHELLNVASTQHLALNSIESILTEIRLIEKKQKKKKIETEDKLKEKEFKEIKEKYKIWEGKFEDYAERIPSNSIDAIITDPPYAKEYLDTAWLNLSQIAKRILRPSGFLITYSGILNLNEVFKILDENLIFYWQFILLHKGVNQLINPRNIFCNYKPILVYQKEPFKRTYQKMDDIIEGSGREKDGHKWQQAEEEIRILINGFTRPNDTILDPFAGSGTIPVCCLKLKRRIVAIIDDKKENIETIVRRLKKYESTKFA